MSRTRIAEFLVTFIGFVFCLNPSPIRFIRILLVDDFALWRAQVREMLAAHLEWRIVSETSTGQEAIQKATELQPEIVILEVALPDLNGIEAAKVSGRNRQTRG